MNEIVSTRFVECQFPDQVKLALMMHGGMPMKAVAWKRTDDVAYGMLSFEPCGENGEFQKHLSVSASSRGKGRRMPTDDEVTAAADACGLNLSECELLRQNQVVHLFRVALIIEIPDASPWPMPSQIYGVTVELASVQQHVISRAAERPIALSDL